MSRGCGLTEEELEDVRAQEQQRKLTEHQSCAERGDGRCSQASCSTSNDKRVHCAHTPTAGSWQRGGTTRVNDAGTSLCVKCKMVEAVVIVRQTEAYCSSCLQESVLLKVRLVARSLLKEGDRVLVAMSGGASSLALLRSLVQVLAENSAARKESNKAVFHLEAIHVLDPAVPKDTYSSRAAELRAAAASTGFAGKLHVVPLADVFAEDAEDAESREARLQQLLLGISDVTGREDLARHLRDELLLRTAATLACHKVARGDNATGRAIRVMADTIKGRGFSLPADLAPVDTRWGAARPEVLLLVSDVTAKELSFVVQEQGVLLVADPQLARSPRASLNQLARTFLESMQVNVPSTTNTVLKLAGHLQPFPWVPEPPCPQRKGGARRAAPQAVACGGLGLASSPRIAGTGDAPGAPTGVDTGSPAWGPTNAVPPVTASRPLAAAAKADSSLHPAAPSDNTNGGGAGAMAAAAAAAAAAAVHDVAARPAHWPVLCAVCSCPLPRDTDKPDTWAACLGSPAIAALSLAAAAATAGAPAGQSMLGHNAVADDRQAAELTASMVNPAADTSVPADHLLTSRCCGSCQRQILGLGVTVRPGGRDNLLTTVQLLPQDIDLSPTGNLLAVGLITGKLELLSYGLVEGSQTVTHKQCHSIQAQPDGQSCRTVRFGYDSGMLFCGGSDGSIAAFDAESGVAAARLLSAHDSPVSALGRLSQAEPHLVTSGDEAGGVALWDARTGKRTMTYRGHTDTINALCAHVRERCLLAASGDGTLSVHDLRTCKLRARSEEDADDEYLSVAVAKNGNKVVCGTQSGALNMFSWGYFNDCSDRFMGHPESVDALVVYDEDTLISGSSDGGLRLLNLLPNKLLGVLGEHSSGLPVERLAISTDRRVLVSASHNTTVKLWDISYLAEEDDDDEDEDAEAGSQDGVAGVAMPARGGVTAGASKGATGTATAAADVSNDTRQGKKGSKAQVASANPAKAMEEEGEDGNNGKNEHAEEDIGGSAASISSGDTDRSGSKKTGGDSDDDEVATPVAADAGQGAAGHAGGSGRGSKRTTTVPVSGACTTAAGGRSSKEAKLTKASRLAAAIAVSSSAATGSKRSDSDEDSEEGGRCRKGKSARREKTRWTAGREKNTRNAGSRGNFFSDLL